MAEEFWRAALDRFRHKFNARGEIGYPGNPGGEDWPYVVTLVDAGIIQIKSHYNTRDPFMHERREKDFDRRIYVLTQTGKQVFKRAYGLHAF